MHHIRSLLPEIKAKIQGSLIKYQMELAQLGDPSESGDMVCVDACLFIDHRDDAHNYYLQSGMILNIITEFCNEYRTVLEGTSNDLSSNELSGGARISYVLHETYGSAIKSFDPFDTVKDVDIRTILYNSSV